MKHHLVADWMTKKVLVAEPDMPMLEAHKIMRENKIRRMPVCEDGRVVGIITRSDVRLGNDGLQVGPETTFP